MSKVGYYISNIFVGALYYADDLTLLAPSADAMCKMLGICDEYAAEPGTMFNAAKSKYIAFTAHHKIFEDSEECFKVMTHLLNESNVGLM
jgi:hypothetical protein